MDSRCKPTHLDSPLTTDVLEEALYRIKTKTKSRNANVRSCMEEVLNLKSALGWKNPHLTNPNLQNLIPLMASELLHMRSNDGDIESFNKVFRSMYYSVPQEYRAYDESSKLDIVKLLNSVFKSPHKPLLMNYYKLKKYLENGVCVSAKGKSFKAPGESPLDSRWTTTDSGMTTSHFQFFRGTMKITISNSLCAIEFLDIIYLSTRNHFLGVSDVFSQRFNICFSAILAEILNLDQYPFSDQIETYYAVGDVILHHYGNDGYKTIKMWESCAVAHLLTKIPDPVTDVNIYYNKIRQDFVSSQGDSEEESLTSLYDEVIAPLLTSLNDHQVCQMFGLYRIFGHPTIDTRRGLVNLQTTAKSVRPCNYDLIKQIGWKWRELLFRQYFSSHKRYPEHEIIGDHEASFLIKSLKDRLPFSRTSPQYHLSDWAFVKLKATFSIPENFSLVDSIADKSLSSPISELRRVCKTTGSIGPAHTRSVIMKHLSSDYQSPLEFLTEIQHTGFKEDNKVIGLYPKEREEKIEGRFFALLTMQLRTYVVLTEEMISNHILPYFPDITMTKDGTSLFKMIHQDTKDLGVQSKKSSSWSVVVNMDFEKWNSNMRREETDMIFKDMDDLFGLENVISRTHEMFEESLIYLADGSFLPFDEHENEVASQCSWRGHLGGLEGMRQKGWTIFTNTLLRYITDNLGIKCTIRGQGDNQVLTVHHVAGDDIRRRHRVFLHSLDILLSQIGPPLKLSETWSSSTLFSYGKYMVFGGKPLAMSLKKICRMMPMTNEGHQNLESTMSSIAANASASVLSDYSPLIPFLLARFNTYEAIRLHFSYPFYSKAKYSVNCNSEFKIPRDRRAENIPVNCDASFYRHVNGMTPEWVALVALIPSVYGGYPGVQITDLISHGFPDPLSIGTWILQRVYLLTPANIPVIKKWIRNVLNPKISVYRNWKLLCQDPTGLNLIHCSSGSDKLKGLVMDFIKTKIPVKNEHFRTFLSHANDDIDPICELLSTMRPLNPRIMHSILDSTLPGVALRVVGKISKSRTIQGLMVKAKNEDISRMAEIEDEFGLERGYFRNMVKIEDLFGRFEYNFFLNFVYTTCSPREEYREVEDIGCSTQYAQVLRQLSWGDEISGVTVAVPQELLAWYPSTGCSCAVDGHPEDDSGYILVNCGCSRNTHIQELPVGPYKPYFGSKTKNKIRFDGGVLMECTPSVLTKAIDNLQIVRWGTEIDSNLTLLIYTIFNSFTDIDPRSFIPQPGDICGSVEHRWLDARTSHSSTLSILFHLSTWIVCNTNGFKPEHVCNVDNVNISFQSILTYISSVMSNKLMLSDKVHESYHLHVDCSDCIRPINEDKLEINNIDLVADHIKKLSETHSKFCFVSKDQLVLNVKSDIKPLFPVKELDGSEQQLDVIYILSLVDFYLGKHPLDVETSFKTLEPDHDELIPAANAVIANIPLFIKVLVVMCYLRYHYDYISYLVKGNELEKILSKFKGVMRNLPLSWYSGLSFLPLNKDGYADAIHRFPGSYCPLGSPPSLSSICRSVQSMVLSFVNTFSLGYCRINLADVKFLPVLLSQNMTLHPFYMTAFTLLLSSDPDVSLNASAFLLRFREVCKNNKEISILNSNSDLRGLLMEDSVLNGLARKSSAIKEVISRGKLLHTYVLQGSFDGFRKYLTKHTTHVDTYQNPDYSIFKSELNGKILMMSKRKATKKGVSIKISEPSISNAPKNLTGHMHKTKGLPSTSPYKLMSILTTIFSSYNSIKNTKGDIISLGDGSGGFTLYASLYLSPRKIYFNTLYESNNLSQFSPHTQYPSALAEYPALIQIVDGIHNTCHETSDLTSRDFSERIPKTYNAKLVMCDAEGGGWEDPSKGLSLITTIVDVCRKTNSKNCIVKSYSSRTDMLYMQVCKLHEVFEDVMIFRSDYSTLDSREVYIIGQRFYNQDTNGTFITSNQSIKFTGMVKSSVDYSSFHSALSDPSNYRCKLKKSSYIDSLIDVTSWSIGQHSWASQYLGSLCIIKRSDKSRIITFPNCLIMSLRSECDLIRYSRNHPSCTKLNFITSHLLRKLAMDYFSLYFASIQDPKEHTHYNSMKLRIYDSVDGKWGLEVGHVDHKPGDKVAMVGDILQDKHWKEIYRTAGRFKEVILEERIECFEVERKDGRYQYAFETPYWFKHGSSLYPQLTPSVVLAHFAETGTSETAPMKLQWPDFRNDPKRMLTAEDAMNIEMNTGLRFWNGLDLVSIVEYAKVCEFSKLASRLQRIMEDY